MTSQFAFRAISLATRRRRVVHCAEPSLVHALTAGIVGSVDTCSGSCCQLILANHLARNKQIDDIQYHVDTCACVRRVVHAHGRGLLIEYGLITCTHLDECDNLS